MTAYRFCRTDDMGLLVAAYESCRGPEDAGTPALDLQGFKQLVRGIDLWCSSCMVALEGREPVGVLLGAKRPAATLIYGLRVHPEHRRRGHGRHLLTSLGQKLAILGPPKLVAEVPAEREAACAVFSACGWDVEARLMDWRCESLQPAADEAAAGEAVAPISLQDLIDGGQLDSTQEGARCWHRDLPALSKLEDQLLGLGFHSVRAARSLGSLSSGRRRAGDPDDGPPCRRSRPAGPECADRETWPAGRGGSLPRLPAGRAGRNRTELPR